MESKIMYIFADLDGTLTKSRQKITQEMKDFLSKVPNLIVVSGSTLGQMRKQLDGFEPQVLMAQSGNICVDDSGVLWANELTDEQAVEITNHIILYDSDPSKIEFRGCQVSYSLTGHNAPQEIKDKADPRREKRKEILKKYPLISDSVEVRIGGTTCLDYTAKGMNKGRNISDYIARKGINKADCIYIGDALFEGGNDESVIGVIKTYQTDGPERTKEIIESILS